MEEALTKPTFKELLAEHCHKVQKDAAKALYTNIIGPMEKGFEAARIQTPPVHSIDGIDLKVLPKYICYRAALLREQLSLQYLLALVSSAFVILFLASRIEVSHLNTKLREKEYILAPGVQDFTPVSPQNVPESHVQNAVMEFLQNFGTFSAPNIAEQYARLEESMSPELKVQFNVEAASWKSKVRDEGISQILTITEKEIRTNRTNTSTNSDGYYHVTAMGRKDTFVNNEHIGATDVVIEMVLKLVPPKGGKRWYLEIEKLSSQDAAAFRTKTGLMKGTGK